MSHSAVVGNLKSLKHFVVTMWDAGAGRRWGWARHCDVARRNRTRGIADFMRRPVADALHGAKSVRVSLGELGCEDCRMWMYCKFVRGTKRARPDVGSECSFAKC